MDFCAKSDVGITRIINEDNYGCYSGDNQNLFYFVVADGMGGHNAGEVASNLLVEYIIERAKESNKTFKTVEKIKHFIRNCIEKANKNIYSSSLADSLNRGMGTTAVMAIIQGNDIVVGNVGDSRAYLLKKEIKKQITVDHSYIEELIKAGIIRREDAEIHPDRHVITRALGMGSDINVDIFTDHFEQGDILILCTDGLTSMIESSTLYEIVSAQLSAEEICDLLIKTANDRGGYDNITVIVAKH